MANEGLITLQDLQERFNASGVYTIYRDQTVNAQAISSPILRLVPGFSKFGIFNVPVFIQKNDKTSATNLFGAIDKSLERKGSYFHRALDIMLEEGPVLAMNLLKVNNEVDTLGKPTANADVVPYRSFSVDITAKNGVSTDKLFASFFDKERFWKPSKNYLLATRNVFDKNQLFNLVNLSQNPLSFIIRKSNVRGFDVTVKDWYANAQIPKYLNPNDYISDYFIDVIIVAGNFGSDKYVQLSIDPVMGQYFDGNGLKADKIDSFLARPEITVMDMITGCLIPNFKDKNGTVNYIEALINAKANTLGVLCAIDKKELDKFETGQNTSYIDLVGHRLIDSTISDVDFLSYKKKLNKDFLYKTKSTNLSYGLNSSLGITIAGTVGKIKVTVTTASPQFELLRDKLELDMLFVGKTTLQGISQGITVSNPMLRVSRLLKTSAQITFDLTSPLKDNETTTSGSFIDLETGGAFFEVLGNAQIGISALGTTGNSNTVVIFNGVSNVTIGTHTTTGSDTLTTANTALVSDINSGTGTHGYSAVYSGGRIYLTPPTGSGYDSTAYTIEFQSTGSAAGTVYSTFVGGISAVSPAIPFETENNRFVIDGTGSFYIGDKGSQLYIDWIRNNIVDGAKITDGTDTYYLKFSGEYAQNGIDINDDFRELVVARLFTDADLLVPASPGNAIPFGATKDSFGFAITDNTLLDIISVSGAIKERFTTTFSSPKKVRLPIANEADVKVGDYLTAVDENGVSILTRIISIKRIGTPAPIEIELETSNTIRTFSTTSGDLQIERYKPLKSFFDRYDFTYLKGFTLRDIHMPDGTNARMKEILSVMLDSNMFDALTDPEMSRFRYYVDTFNHGLEFNSKREISNLIKTRQKCLGLLNCPSLDEFRDSFNPRFTTTPTAADPLPVLQVQYIRDGGNVSENPDFLYTLPEEQDGASYVGFFFPNVVISDVDDVSFPPAPFVSNNFIRKYRNGSPYLPVAGPRRGVLSGNGLSSVEYPLSKKDRGFLEEKGINPIVQKADGTIMIYGDETSYQKFNSILNNLSSRDALISMEIDSENILSEYVFEYNDDSMRTEVSSLLKSYYQTLMDGYGAIDYFDIVFDRNNNRDFVIRENAAVVDTIVSLKGVAKKFINRITLRRGATPTVGTFTAI